MLKGIGRESSAPEKFNTRDDDEGEVRLTRKSTVLSKSKENKAKQCSSILENCGNNTESHWRFSQSSSVIVQVVVDVPGHLPCWLLGGQEYCLHFPHIP